MDWLISSPYTLVTMCLNSFELLEQKSIFVLTLKPIKLQHNDEICISVNVAKAEKINWMIYGEIKALLLKYYNVLSVIKMGNQQRSPEQGNVQRLRAFKC